MKKFLVLLGAFLAFAPGAALADGYYYGQPYPYIPPANYNASDCNYTYSPYYQTSYVCNTNAGVVNQNYYPDYYPSYPQNQYSYSSLILSSLSPNTAPPGSTVVIYGTGFDASDNVVYFGNQATIAQVPSNGTSLSFMVPLYATGTVQLSVQNPRGTSNALTFTVQAGYGYNYGCLYYNTCPQQPIINYGYGSPMISYLNPPSGGVGTEVGIYGSGFSPTGNSIQFGSGIIANLVSTDGTTLNFTVPSWLNGYGNQPVGVGTYNVSVKNAAGVTTNSMPFTVTSLWAGIYY